jgi:two-component system, chemotaxis family, CheB/CheR fusion protein
MDTSEQGPPAAGDRQAVLLVNRRGKAVASSSGFGELFGQPEQLKLWNAAGQPLPKEQWPPARLQRGESFCSTLEVEVIDSSRKLFNVSGYPLSAADGSPAGGVVVLEEAGSIDEPGHVAALVSHELRTPLTVLHAALQLMERSLTAGDEALARHYLGEALAEARQLNVLTAQLLEAARLSNRELRIRTEQVRLAPLLRGVCARAQALARGQHIELELTGLDEDVRVEADRARLEQMVMQLLVNAITYAPGTSHVDVVARVSGHEVAIQVRDFGSGVRGQRLARLADPFYQAPRGDRPSRSGLGLGLFVCRELAQLHGGRLDISAQQEAGTAVTLWLPVSPEEGRGARVRIRQDVSAARHSRP